MSSNGMYMRVVGQKVKDATEVKIPGGGDGEFFEIMNWSMSKSRTVSMNTDTKNQDQGTIHFDPINISMLKSGASPLLYSMMLKFDKTYQLEIVETKPASKGDGVEISHKVTLDEARTIGRSISSVPDSVAHENFTFLTIKLKKISILKAMTVQVLLLVKWVMTARLINRLHSLFNSVISICLPC